MNLFTCIITFYIYALCPELAAPYVVESTPNTRKQRTYMIESITIDTVAINTAAIVVTLSEIRPFRAAVVKYIKLRHIRILKIYCLLLITTVNIYVICFVALLLSIPSLLIPLLSITLLLLQQPQKKGRSERQWQNISN